MKDGLEARTGIPAAFKATSQCLYLADPSRLSILGIEIVAQASIEQSTVFNSSNGASSYDSASSPTRATIVSCPPTSYRSPVRSASFTPSANGNRLDLPELGQHSRDTLPDISRGYNDGRRQQFSNDLGDIEGHTAQSLDSLTKRSASNSSESDSSHVTSELAQQEQRTMSARCVYSMRSESVTSISSTSTPLKISSRMEAASSTSSKSQWDRLGPIRTEFVEDDEVSQVTGRAGIFSADREEEFESEANGDEGDHEDATQAPLLLKVTPPMQYLRQRSSRHSGREICSVIVRFSLRLLSLQTKSLRGPRISPAGPRTQRVGGIGCRMGSESSIIFISTHSLHKLHEAIKATKRSRDGNFLEGPLSSARMARTEGIDWALVGEEEVCKSDCFSFERHLDSLSRSSTYRMGLLGERIAKCVCAFVELNTDSGTARMLALFCFLIALPPTITSTTGQDCPKSPEAPTAVRSPPIDRGIGLGLCDVNTLAPVFPVLQASSPDPAVCDNKIGLYSRLRRGSGGALSLYSPSRARQRSSFSSEERSCSRAENSNTVSATKVSLDVDFSEIRLEDVEEDGPILRAALANLERRTASLKTAAKAIVKASEEVRANLRQLQASEASLSETLEAAAHYTPSTLGYLQSQLLRRKHEGVLTNLQGQTDMLTDHVETPLLALIDKCRSIQEQLKTFELESRSYYAGTQKWLSSRSTAPTGSAPTSREATEVYSSAAVGYDKVSSKQDRCDDKQRLRQARFHLARLDIFRAVKHVHGGEAEIQLASHLLALCRWQCSDNKALMQNFEEALQLERIKIHQQDGATLRKYKEVQEQIHELNEILGKSVLDTEADIATTLPSSEPEVPRGAKTRQAGNRIKNLLSALGSSKQYSSVANLVDASSSTRGAMISPTKWRKEDDHTSKQSSPALNDANFSLAKTQQRSWPLSFAAPQHDSSHWRKPSTLDSLSATPLSRSASIGATSTREDRTLFPVAACQQRSSSNTSAVSTSQAHSSLSTAAGQTSSTADRHTSSARQATDISRADHLEGHQFSDDKADHQKPSKVSLLQPRRAALQSRKKEGILWAMSKSVAGSGGADAPKSVSRSQNWRECWVVLSGSGHLGQYAEWKDVKVMEPSQPLIDLRFATVREARGVERRFTFEVVTRENRRFFQANNEEEMRNWIKAISFAIESLLNGTSSIRQIDKVARVAAGSGSSMTRAGDEFGSQVAEPSALGRHRAFSQSLTDLSTASGGGAGRLFHRSADRGEVARQRDSKKINSVASNHISALSEGGGPYASAALDFPSIPPSQTPQISHERGISNKTPVSGYVQQLQSDILERSETVSSAWTVEPEYDRKIEEMINSDYGGLHHAHGRSISLLSSVSPSRQSSQTSQKDTLVATISSTSSSTKYTRSKEIIDIAARAENSFCADCRSDNPRWASWSLNGEPRCIFICIICSGHHRGLGVGVSRVKSIDLDDWTEEQLIGAREWGNFRVNALYEAKKPRDVTVATAKGKHFWIEKYVNKSWYEEGSAIVADDWKVERQDATPKRRADGARVINTAGLPRWPASPPLVSVSTFEGDRNHNTAWRKSPGPSLSSPSTSTEGQRYAKLSFDDTRSSQQSATSSPSPMQKTFHRFPRHSNDKIIAV